MTTPSNELRGGTDGFKVDLSADTTFSVPARQVKVAYNGTAGAVKVDFVDGRLGVLWPLDAGEKDVMQVTKIYSTSNGTTATEVWVLI